MRPLVSQSPKYPNNIRKVMDRHGWTLDQVVEKTGIPRRTLIDYCAGRTAVPSDRLADLCQCLEYPANYLVPPFPEAYLLSSENDQIKEAQSLSILQTHCKKSPRDEEALRALMAQLGKLGRYDEIEQWYAQLIKELQQYIRRGPDPSTTGLLEDLRAQKGLASEKVGPAAQTNDTVLEDPATHSQEVSVHSSTSSSDWKKEPPRPNTSSPTTPSDTETTLEGTRETVKQSGTIQVVFLVSPSDAHINGTIPKVRLLEKGDSDTDPLRRKLGGLFKQAAQVSIVGALAPEFLGRPDLLERLERAVTRPSLIDTPFLEGLRSSVTNCYKLHPEIVGIISFEHLNTVHTHLNYLIELLESSLYPSVRKSLTSLAAECSLIIGTLYHSMHLPTVAERYFMTARTAAEEADNQALKAVIHGRMSMLPEHSLTLIQEALPLAKKHGTDTSYSWLQARIAEAYTEHLSRDRQYVSECEKALEQATAFSPKGDPEHDPYWTCFNECLMYGYQGACYVKLQKPEAAKIALLQALQLSNPQNPYHQIDLQIDLARVYQLQDDIINACLCGHHALSLISRTHSVGHLQGLEGFRSQFPAGETDSALQAFDEHKMSVQELLAQHAHFQEVG